MVEQLRGSLLDPWAWSAFLGEQGGLASIYAEAEDSASKRCISKVGGAEQSTTTIAAAAARHVPGQPRRTERREVSCRLLASMPSTPLCSFGGRLGPVLFLIVAPPTRVKCFKECRCLRSVASQVVRHLLRMLETSAKGAQPRGDEAQRILSFFMSSLKNPTLVSEPRQPPGRGLPVAWPPP